MNRRVILHADMNNCYASIEMLHHPKLRGHPVAVGGNAEQRHGIILARNYEARPFGVTVGQALWEARERCPNLIIVPPDYEKYMRFSKLFKKILSEYSSQVEPFGLDESWVDVTGSLSQYSSGESLANEIRKRVKFELGITVSVGVSYNKVFAKLGSDIKKPDATTVISEDNYRSVVWPLPVSDLLGVGRSTKARLMSYGIKSIGDLARCDTATLKSWFHKWGLFLHSYANGLDSSPVADIGMESIIKSIGNSTTCPRDLLNDDDAHIVFQNLAESVAERMREQGLMARTVQISLRTNDLFWFERQMPLPKPSHISTELCDVAMNLLRQNWDWSKPLRSIGIRGTNLMPILEYPQLSLFEDDQKREKVQNLEFVIDDIRRRFGHYSIDRALLLLDDTLGNISPISDHVIHPIGYMN